MQPPKDRLIQLIEAYCAAKISGNTTLVQFAANTLSSFLGSVEVIEVSTDGQDQEAEAGK